jgi:type I restriction-modification system DNA methylase subunit
MDRIDNVRKAITEASVYSKEKSGDFGEVFTPYKLIEDMLDTLDSSIWSDKTKTFFDPCAGKGNFPICIIRRLFDGLAKGIPDEEERLKHIVQKQIFMAEYQKDSADFLREQFTFGIEGLRPNLYHGDTLEMPDTWFDKPLEEREKILKENPDGYEPNKATDLFGIFC